MKRNPIPTEIRRARDERVRDSGYDVRKFMDFIREHWLLCRLACLGANALRLAVQTEWIPAIPSA